jgi:uncharacterized membrane protein
MAIATYITRASGFYVASRFQMTPKIRAALNAVPAAILVSIIGPQLAKGGLPELLSAAIVVFLALRKQGLLVCLAAGIIAINLFRYLLN